MLKDKLSFFNKPKGYYNWFGPKFRDLGLFQRWTIKKMVVVAMLIAISVAFTIISSQIVPVASIPSFKIAFIGLPVKITGFIFGPIIGFFVGLIADLLSLLFVPPVTYHILYTLATAMNGLIAGIVGWFFIRFLNYAFNKEIKARNYEYKIWRLSLKLNLAISTKNTKQIQQISAKIIKFRNLRDFVMRYGIIERLQTIYMIISTIIIISIIISIIAIGLQIPDASFKDIPVIKGKAPVLTFMITGYTVMCLFVIIGRYYISAAKYFVFAPIIVFSSILEFVNLPILALADSLGLGNGTNELLFWIISRTVFSPIKIWFNIFVIYFSYSVIYKLVNKNKDNTYN
ncbi:MULTISPECIES: ECF transporter S component [unclassified Mycoplasma]|uniref:ECF transporter S component n=1 Tax=unclassified Mycoplasma TaxID=2683645 RepID=UPI00211C8A7A|nr:MULTISPECIES: ECF transporter S component [unclassified Mycoplasma]UUM20001.1 ECF transporter S component [Mycoplasma sp. 1578d]UUM24982.1 ECF transporter S component [Mycoplasma sp. 3686d]